MNIDFLITDKNEAGLLCTGEMESLPAGIMLDVQSGELTLEFTDMSSLEMNIPLSPEIISRVKYTRPSVHFGLIADTQVDEAKQLPLMLINDQSKSRFRQQPRHSGKDSILAFEIFMKKCQAGQPVHRENLDDDEHTGSVMGGMSPAVLQLAPHLAQQRTMEAAPKMGPKMGMAPRGPSGPSAPGLGGGGSGAPYIPQQNQFPTDDDE